jgi:hypothetical protein
MYSAKGIDTFIEISKQLKIIQKFSTMKDGSRVTLTDGDKFLMHIYLKHLKFLGF